MDKFQANHELALLYTKISVERYLKEFPKAADDSIMVRVKDEYIKAMELYNGSTSYKD